MVNLRDAEIEVHTEPTGGAYARQSRVGRGASVSPRAFPDVVLAADELFG